MGVFDEITEGMLDGGIYVIVAITMIAVSMDQCMPYFSDFYYVSYDWVWGIIIALQITIGVDRQHSLMIATC